MNILSQRPLATVLALLFCMISYQAHAFDIMQEKVNKIHKKSIKYKAPLEFKQAVSRYIKNTDTKYFHAAQRTTNGNAPYEKELTYLFKNYGKLSAITLLSRLRSAHYAMVKQDTNTDGEAYKRYEQICSALLLVCAQVFFNDIRNQILNTLHEIDNLIVYWRYQQNHQLRYFFSKSPHKWIVGKAQHTEIAHNLIRLGRKQDELYIFLGSLTGHAHVLTETGLSFEDCYKWIEQLGEMTSCIKSTVDYTGDDTQFDIIACQLEAKIKRVNSFKSECMKSVKSAYKAHHLVRNWIAYTTLLAAIIYTVRYSSKNPEAVRSALQATQDEMGKFFILLVHPVKQIYERVKLIFSDEKKMDENKKQISDDKNKKVINLIDRDAQLTILVDKIVKIGKEMDSDIARVLTRSETNIRATGLNLVKDTLDKLKNPQDGWIWNSSYSLEEKPILDALGKIQTIVMPIKVGDKVINEKEIKEYKESYKIVKDFVSKFQDDATKWSAGGWAIRADLRLAGAILTLDDDFLDPLLGYTDIIDNKILPIFTIATEIIENLVAQAIDLIRDANNLEAQAAQDLAQAAQQLKDQELTLMFSSLLPLGFISFIANKGYQWSISRDYSPIRIALSDVNSLLIEAVDYLDDHDYGKLVYLICKLKHRAMYLKDSMAEEFLADVAKLESKQYTAHVKRAIVENMFNRYAFLGRIAV